jgi:hypothetical protein
LGYGFWNDADKRTENDYDFKQIKKVSCYTHLLVIFEWRTSV